MENVIYLAPWMTGVFFGAIVILIVCWIYGRYGSKSGKEIISSLREAVTGMKIVSIFFHLIHFVALALLLYFIVPQIENIFIYAAILAGISFIIEYIFRNKSNKWKWECICMAMGCVTYCYYAICCYGGPIEQAIIVFVFILMIAVSILFLGNKKGERFIILAGLFLQIIWVICSIILFMVIKEENEVIKIYSALMLIQASSFITILQLNKKEHKRLP